MLHQGKTTPRPDCDCARDPIQALEQLFVDLAQRPRINAGQSPARRAVFLKPHGCAFGTFTVRPDLPEHLRVGVFRHASFPAWVRFSSDTVPLAPDLRTTLGMAIKLFAVPGQKLLATEEAAPTHDFILQNYDIFFVDNVREMCEFTYAGVKLHDYDSYLKTHPTTQRILDEMQQEVASALLSDYWSVLPYAFGPGRYVKYVVRPLRSGAGGVAHEVDRTNSNYLHDDLKGRLLRDEAHFEFCIQPRTDLDAMPLDRATVRWDEARSEPIRVATLALLRQDIDAPGQAEYGENLSYNPWHALAEHAPVGSISEARRVVYKASADLRRDVNGIPLGEPLRPRKTPPAPAAAG